MKKKSPRRSSIAFSLFSFAVCASLTLSGCGNSNTNSSPMPGPIESLPDSAKLDSYRLDRIVCLKGNFSADKGATFLKWSAALGNRKAISILKGDVLSEIIPLSIYGDPNEECLMTKISHIDAIDSSHLRIQVSRVTCSNECSQEECDLAKSFEKTNAEDASYSINASSLLLEDTTKGACISSDGGESQAQFEWSKVN